MAHYFHLYSNGDDSKNFIISYDDFRAAFNYFGVCATVYHSVKILAFSIEETHPHALIFGELKDCISFKKLYETLILKHIIASRGSRDGVNFEVILSKVEDEEYLLNVAAYVLVQPTKDGKQILPQDYRWGTASLYFKPKGKPDIWLYDSEWHLCKIEQYGSQTYRSRRKITFSRRDIPEDWEICNGIILPTNYLDVEMFESIFKSYNRFRVYMSAGKKQLQLVSEVMAKEHGLTLDDMEARTLAKNLSINLFGKADIRSLTVDKRIKVAKELRFKSHLSFKQISRLIHIPESEIRMYFE